MGIIPPGAEADAAAGLGAEPWDSLSADEKTLYARFMENFAGFLAFTDHEVRPVARGDQGAAGCRQYPHLLHRRR